MELQKLIEEFPDIEPELLREMLAAEEAGGYIFGTESGIIDGLRCPHCYRNDSLRVSFVGEAALSSEGSEDVGDHEWGHDSEMSCRHCGLIRPRWEFDYDHATRCWTYESPSLEDQLRTAQNAKDKAEQEIERLALLLLEVNNEAAQGQVFRVVLSETLTEVWERDIVASTPREAAQKAYDFVVEDGYLATPSKCIVELEREIEVDGELIDLEEETEEEE